MLRYGLPLDLLLWTCVSVADSCLFAFAYVHATGRAPAHTPPYVWLGGGLRGPSLQGKTKALVLWNVLKECSNHAHCTIQKIMSFVVSVDVHISPSMSLFMCIYMYEYDVCSCKYISDIHIYIYNHTYIHIYILQYMYSETFMAVYIHIHIHILYII